MPTEPSLVVFIVAHPDDEFFCSVFLADEALAGMEVHVVYLTDGAFGGQSVQRRVDESIRVLGRYGVKSSRVHFVGARHDIPDGDLPRHMMRAWDALREVLPRHPERVYTTAWEGGHQDHDACHAIAWRMAIEYGCSDVRQFPLYNGHETSPPLFRVMTALEHNGPIRGRCLAPREIARMLANAFAYPSQWKTWLGLLPFAAWRMISARRMEWQSASAIRLNERPHPGKLLYERRGNAQFDDVHAMIRAFLQQP